MAVKKKQKWKKYRQSDLNKLLEKSRGRCVVKARFIRPHAGGVPAKEEGVRAFTKYHLGLTEDTDEFEEAVQRIMKEEIGERNTAQEEDELDTENVYQLNVIRKNGHGPFILEHMIKAVMKVAASRLGIFQKQRGSKGDMAEMGTVLAHGDSLQNPKRPWEIYLRHNKAPVKTYYEKIQGCVNTPNGRKSIQHHTELCKEGAEFEFEFRWMNRKLTKENIPQIMAAATAIGIGSCLSLGYGRFEILELAVEN